jgi:predicted membrane-bound spermidine synthase
MREPSRFGHPTRAQECIPSTGADVRLLSGTPSTSSAKGFLGSLFCYNTYMNNTRMRVNRSTFLLVILANIVANLAFFKLGRYVTSSSLLNGMLSIISLLVVLWTIYVITLRLQDFGQSKWWGVLNTWFSESEQIRRKTTKATRYPNIYWLIL